MKQNKGNLPKIIGAILFVLALFFFSVQIGYLFLSVKYQFMYIDDRLFYIINIFFIICLLFAIGYLLRLSKKFKLLMTGLGMIFIIGHLVMLVVSNQEIKNINSLSPDWQHILSIKNNLETGKAVYYRSDYSILAQPKEALPHKITGNFKTKWLANDIAAVTYETKDKTIQQFIGTYGDRGRGRSYYEVGAEIHGEWRSENTKILSDTKGISVTVNHDTELFKWDNIEQFGTLAIVLKRNNEAVWTLSLNENFEIYTDASKPNTGNISLYKATMKKNEPVILDYKGSH